MSLSRTLFAITLFLLTISPITNAATEKTASNDTKPIIVMAKQPRFTIRLISNPTTGYRWFIKSYSSHFIMPVKHNIEKPTSQLAGAPTYEIFTFKLKPSAFVSPHELNVRFIYARPFEPGLNNQSRNFRIMTLE